MSRTFLMCFQWFLAFENPNKEQNLFESDIFLQIRFQNPFNLSPAAVPGFRKHVPEEAVCLMVGFPEFQGFFKVRKQFFVIKSLYFLQIQIYPACSA